MGDFNLPEVNWEYHTADTNSSRRFLQHLDGNFLVQVLREPTRKCASLTFVACKKESLVGEVATGSNLGHCDNEEDKLVSHLSRQMNAK